MSSKTSLQKIVFYDTSRINNPEQTVSPWTVVTQWSLKVKGLAYDRKIIDLADVDSVSKEAGFGTTDGPWNNMRTFPAIIDPNTGAKIADSFAIAEYLDETYSGEGQPRLIPKGTKSLHKAFLVAMTANEFPCYLFILPTLVEKGEDKDKEYVIETRERLFGKPIKDIMPKGEDAVTQWTAIKEKYFGVFDTWFEEGATYLTGETPVLADFYLAGRVFWFRATFGEESKEWKDVSSWNGGRWQRFLDSILEKYPLDRV